jgi:hypothetical protein
MADYGDFPFEPGNLPLLFFNSMTGPFQAAEPAVERFAFPFQPGVHDRKSVGSLSTIAIQSCNQTATDDPSAGSRHGEVPC